MSTEKFHNQGLSYYCNQTPEDMQQKESGYYCHLCSKNIIDFRGKSRLEYQQLVKENYNGCGIFYANQIEPFQEIKINWRRPFMVVSFWGLFMFSRNVQAQDSTVTKVEYSSIEDSIDHTKNVDTTNVVQNKTKKCTQSKEGKHQHYKGKRVLFVNKRFPFIHYKRIPVLGGRFWY